MATISFTTTFDLTASPKLFLFEDTADYVGQGIALADVNGSFRITSPSGAVIYNNPLYTGVGCDIENSASRENQTTIQLPLGSDGMPEAGVYTILYTVYDSNLLTYSTVTNTYTYAYTRPEVAITQTSDCISPLFTSTDATNYVVNGVSPTSTVRQHLLSFPLGSGLSQLSSASAVITAGFEEFANGTQATQITTTITYDFDDGLIVRDTITGAQEFVVDCTYICTVYCGIRSIEQQMVAAECNPVEYQRLVMLFAQISALVQLAKLAIECGKPTDVNGYLERMYLIGNFNDDCACSGDTPTLVTGLGGAGNTVIVESGDATVIVTPVVVGSTTTYTVTLSSAFVTLVNTHYNTVVVAGTNITVTDSGIVGGVRTFTVNATATNPVLYNTQTAVSTTNAAMTILQSYTLIADQLSANGDVVELTADFDTDGVTQAKAYDLRIGGTVCHSKVTEFRQTGGQKASRLIVRITRQSATTLFITFLQSNSNTNYQTLGDGRLFYETGFSVSNLTSNTTALEVRGRNIDGAPTETINCAQLLVMYYKK